MFVKSRAEGSHFMWKASQLCVAGTPWRPSFSRKRYALRPCMVSSMCTQATYGAAFGIKRCGRNDAFGLKIRLIVKFSRKSLSEWF